MPFHFCVYIWFLHALHILSWYQSAGKERENHCIFCWLRRSLLICVKEESPRLAEGAISCLQRIVTCTWGFWIFECIADILRAAIGIWSQSWVSLFTEWKAPREWHPKPPEFRAAEVRRVHWRFPQVSPLKGAGDYYSPFTHKNFRKTSAACMCVGCVHSKNFRSLHERGVRKLHTISASGVYIGCVPPS
jgi:hypothetical protein